MPQPLSSQEVTAVIEDTISEAGATSIKDMGKVMGLLKARVQGRADMGEIGALVKAQLS
jgi:hypothetical protein